MRALFFQKAKLMHFFLVLLIHLSPTLFASDDVETLEKLKSEMTQTIQNAKACIPQKQKLCTGVTFTETSLKNLQQLSLAQCKRELKKLNFTPMAADKNRTLYQGFINSTMRALTLFDEKTVLYKTNQFDRLDCIHELLHVHQHDPNLDRELSPATRKSTEEQFMKHLNLAVIELEKAEREKNTGMVKHLGDKIQSDINFIKSWKEMNSWLDEKDIHYFIYSQCEEFKCTNLDKDIALSNLFKLAAYLPDREANLIKKDASIILKTKEEKAISEMEKLWKKTTFSRDEVQSMLGLSWDQLLKKLLASKMIFFRVGHSIRLKQLDTIPEDILLKIQIAPPHLVNDSKLSNGQAFAKYLPQAKQNLILVTPITTKTSLVHEYLHFLQAKINVAYKNSLRDAPKLMTLFLSGKLSRESYEEKAMLDNALASMGEYEVYQTLAEFKDVIPEIEHQNNVELYSFYKKKLHK